MNVNSISIIASRSAVTPKAPSHVAVRQGSSAVEQPALTLMSVKSAMAVASRSAPTVKAPLSAVVNQGSPAVEQLVLI